MYYNAPLTGYVVNYSMVFAGFSVKQRATALQYNEDSQW